MLSYNQLVYWMYRVRCFTATSTVPVSSVNPIAGRILCLLNLKPSVLRAVAASQYPRRDRKSQQVRRKPYTALDKVKEKGIHGVEPQSRIRVCSQYAHKTKSTQLTQKTHSPIIIKKRVMGCLPLQQTKETRSYPGDPESTIDMTEE